MTQGIKRKVLSVLVGVLLFSTLLNVLLASYFTNHQNEQAAFAGLDNELFAWQTDLQTLSQQLKRVAVATVRDVATLDQFSELMTLEFNLADPSRAAEREEYARTLGYRKTVSINRLQLALRTGGFSAIEVYTQGQLSHAITPTGAGMRVARTAPQQPWAWVGVAANAAGDLPLRSWPAWPDLPAPRRDPRLTSLSAPAVAVVFSAGGEACIRVSVPVQGTAEDSLSDEANFPYVRFFSNLSVVGDTPLASPTNPPVTGRNRKSVQVGEVVFEKRIDRAMLELVANKTSKLPLLLSPDGRHRQVLAERFPAPPDAMQPQQTGQASHDVVSVGDKSFYLAFAPWQLEGHNSLVLGLATPRDSTLANVRQTVLAILLAAGATMLVGLVVGLSWLQRLIDPVVRLTEAVKRITGCDPGAAAPTRAERLRPVEVDEQAPREVGALALAFNGMVLELQQAFETLEHRVQERTAELRQQATYLRTLIDVLPMRAWLKDTDGRFLVVNQAEAERSTAHSPEQLLGKSDTDIWPQDKALAYRAEDQAVMRSRTRMVREEHRSTAAGTEWIETYKAPVIDDDGQVLGTVGVVRDISDRKAAEAARESALAEAQRLARLRSEFLSQMSHELRTPLNGVLGFAQLLQADQGLTERQLRGLRIIEDSGRHLLALIDDILDMARIDASKLSLQAAELNLPQLLQTVLDIVRVKADEKQLQFHCGLGPDLPTTVYADERRLRQVLLNLLSNAVKFTDRGTVTLKVRVLPGASPGRPAGDTVTVRFEVHDTGIGMDEAQLGRLFQPFEQFGDRRRREGGTGLGLAISRQLVRLMGGDVEVRSRAGMGSVFAFELALPVVPPHQTTRHGAATAPSTGAGLTDNPPP